MKQGNQTKYCIIKRIIKIVSLLVAISIVLGLMQHYIMRRFDAHQRRVQGFYMEEKDSLDMVIIGSSEVYNGYMPPLAYENFGISSYLFGFQAEPDSLWSYHLKEIERTQDPEILIIECNGAGYDKDELDNPAEVRFLTDDMPLSLNKIQLIHDKATEAKPSYYFPFLKYHQHLMPGGDTLNTLLLDKRGFHILRGAQARVTGEDLSKDVIDVSNDDSLEDLDPDGEMYLRAFLEQCKESNIKHIVFVRFPHVVTERNYDRFQRYHRAEQIIKEAGFDYIDFDEMKDEIGINIDSDFLDSEHMSLRGAEKFTNFMVPYLMDRYQVEPKEQSAKAISQWEQSVDYYHRLYEYWCYIESQDSEVISETEDLNDNYGSNRRIEQYFKEKLQEGD